jgi:hypothetical protein
VNPYHERRQAERAVLRSEEHGSVGEALRELTKCGLTVFDEPVFDDEDSGRRREEAIVTWAAATLRAVSVACVREHADEDCPADVKFTTNDAAVVLSGVVAMLEEGIPLARLVREANREEGGAP